MVHPWAKYDENPPRGSWDFVLTRFSYGRTDGQPENIMPPAPLRGGGIKIYSQKMTEKSSRLNDTMRSYLQNLFPITLHKLQCERQTSREQSHNFVFNPTLHIQSIGLLSSHNCNRHAHIINLLKTIYFARYNPHFPLTPARVYSGLVFNGLIKLALCYQVIICQNAGMDELKLGGHSCSLSTSWSFCPSILGHLKIINKWVMKLHEDKPCLKKEQTLNIKKFNLWPKEIVITMYTYHCQFEVLFYW